MGKMGEMGGKWEKIRENGESSTDQDGTCRNEFQSGGGKGVGVGGEWEKNGTKGPFVAVPFFRRPKPLSSVPFVKFGVQVSAEKMGKMQGICRYPANRVPTRLGILAKPHGRCAHMTSCTHVSHVPRDVSSPTTGTSIADASS